jgi:hypothetical protein
MQKIDIRNKILFFRENILPLSPILAKYIKKRHNESSRSIRQFKKKISE